MRAALVAMLGDWNHNLMLGLLNVSGTHDPNRMCGGTGFAWTRESHHHGHGLIALLTVGLYVPSKIEVQRAAKPR